MGSDAVIAGSQISEPNEAHYSNDKLHITVIHDHTLMRIFQNYNIVFAFPEFSKMLTNEVRSR